MPSAPPSRPMPDCLTPPKGAAAFETTPTFRPIIPERVDHAVPAGEVLGEDVRDETVLGVVRQAHGLRLGLERRDREHGSEDLLAEDVAAGGDVCDDGRFEEGPLPVDCVTSDEHAGTARGGVLDQRTGLRDGIRIDERADRDVGVRTASDFHRPYARGDAVGEFSGDGRMHDEPVGGRAGLPDVSELRRDRPVHSLLEVGVIEDDERSVAAELHRYPQHTVGRLRDERSADLGRPGEGQLAQARIREDRRRQLRG